MIFTNGDFDGRWRYGDFHHIIHLVNIIGVTKFGGSKEVNNFLTHNKKSNVFLHGDI